MTGRQSLSTRALILSGPGDLFVGGEVTIWRISSHDTVLKLKLDVMKESSCASVTHKFHSGKLCSAPTTKFFPYAVADWLLCFAKN